MESAAILFGSGTERCVRVFDTKERMTKSYLTMDEGEKAAAEAVKAMIPATENFIFINLVWQCVGARERSEQIRELAWRTNAKSKLEDAGWRAYHARRKGGVANFGNTPNYFNFQNEGVLAARSSAAGTGGWGPSMLVKEYVKKK